jgi:hypothetical protein
MSRKIDDLRSAFDAFVSKNSARTVGECKEALRDLINQSIKAGFEVGGEEMREGLMDELRRNGY